MSTETNTGTPNEPSTASQPETQPPATTTTPTASASSSSSSSTAPSAATPIPATSSTASAATSTAAAVSRMPAVVPLKVTSGRCVVCKQTRDVACVCKSCSSPTCVECASKHVDRELVGRRRSPLLLACPYRECKGPMIVNAVRAVASPEATTMLNNLFATIPATHPVCLADLRYHFNEAGELRQMASGERYHYISEIHYDIIGDYVVKHIQDVMKEKYHMKEVLLPVDDPNGPYNNIFVSEDLKTNTDKLMIIIQGSGAVRPGQWARALCLNDSLTVGSILPYIERAQSLGYSLAILNPNLNRAPIKEPPPLTWEDFFNTDKSFGSTRQGRCVNIKGNASPIDHTIYAWRNVISQSPAAHIVIVAHSAGGFCTSSLLESEWDALRGRLNAVALTDSFLGGCRNAEIRQFIAKNCINWAASDQPLDTPLRSTGEKRVSAGHNTHEWTSSACITSVFPWLENQITEAKRR